jgi:hypothetical protein
MLLLVLLLIHDSSRELILDTVTLAPCQSNSVKQLIHHKDYYIKGGDLYIMVSGR